MKSHNHAINPGKITMEQFEECKSHDFVIEAALMPDAHVGYAAPIGSVLITKGKVVPAWVGFDIGCGMTSAHLEDITIEKIKQHTEEIYNKVKESVPMGLGMTSSLEDVTKETKEKFNEILEKFKKGPYNPNILEFLERKALKHLGSLGEGNHFIELGKYNDEVWITVHSGSRGIGFQVAEKYMKKSAGSDQNFEATFPLDVDSELGKEYLNVLDFGLEFALLNRLEIIRKTIIAISDILNKKLEYEVWTNKNHNHAILEDNTFIHRKGATPAKKGERGVIPGNMKEGCFLVEGLGKDNFLNSSSHGAGRIMSRSGAKNNITMEEFKESMVGIRGTITEGTLDEAPMAYKNIYDVMEAQKDSVKVLKHLTPVINWKGDNKRKKWRK